MTSRWNELIKTKHIKGKEELETWKVLVQLNSVIGEAQGMKIIKNIEITQPAPGFKLRIVIALI